ncbi:MAG: transglycosylase domain-containing protein [Oscillospiraceae bacterium]|nr:transglycosylase domain-containing protein [Oscillospiraceae bacterium]
MTKKTQRIVKKVAKNGAWAISDIFFIALKALGTGFMILLTTVAVFSCIFLIYLRTNISTGLEINPNDIALSEASVIFAIDPETGEEVDLVTLQWTEFRRNVTLEEVPEHLIEALLAIEDHRFWRHNGVDWYRTAGAFMNMFLSMRDTFGGSTITQQLIKNLTHEDDVTVQRKLQEIFRALEFERQWSKDEILEMYLNIIYFGHGRFGIGEAANFYFGKDVSELTLAESAAIVGITNNPSRFSPYANRRANKERQEIILRRMHELEFIDEHELRHAINEPLNFRRGEDETFQPVIYTWFEEAIIRDVIRDLQMRRGYNAQWATRVLYTHGLRIRATIDLEMQAIVDNIYQNRDNLPRVTGSTQPLQSGIIVADPFTGEVRALSGGTGAKTSNMLLNRATMTRRPPGSAIKPISVFAPAMEFGLIIPSSQYNDSPNTSLNGTTWMPRNADRSFRGVVTVETALRLSLNTVPAIILDEMGPSAGFSFLTDALGFQLNPADENYAPLAAGQLTNGATVREMTSGFTIFPTGGERMELRTYSRIYDTDGNIFMDNPPVGVRVLEENNAHMMTAILHQAVVNGTGGAANLGRSMPTAGKTGTSNESQDRWFVGFTGYYIAGVWTGFDTPARMSSQGNPAAHIFRMVMTPIHEGLETRQFTTPGRPTHRPPVGAGGIETTSYTLNLLDIMGSTISQQSRTGILGEEITVHAPALQYYEIVGDRSRTITLSSDPGRNQIVFVYRWIGSSTADPDNDDDDDGDEYTPPDELQPDLDPTPDPQPEPDPTPDPIPDPPPQPDPAPDPIPDPPPQPDPIPDPIPDPPPQPDPIPDPIPDPPPQPPAPPPDPDPTPEEPIWPDSLFPPVTPDT